MCAKNLQASGNIAVTLSRVFVKDLPFTLQVSRPIIKPVLDICAATNVTTFYMDDTLYSLTTLSAPITQTNCKAKSQEGGGKSEAHGRTGSA
jgi:hypothetical protein